MDRGMLVFMVALLLGGLVAWVVANAVEAF